MTTWFDKIMAEAEEVMKTADGEAPMQPSEAPQDDLAVSAERVLTQLREVLEANGEPSEESQPPVAGGAQGGSGAPVININYGVSKTAAGKQAEAFLRMMGR